MVIAVRFLFLSLLFALLVAIFAVQNATPVTVAFLSGSFQTSLVIIILGAATFGALIILSLALFSQFKLQRLLRAARQREQQLQGEIAGLRRLLPKQHREMSEDQEQTAPLPAVGDSNDSGGNCRP